ncbi:replication factor a protein 3 protein [Cardiosporidium cionae]|uniref:Replication factor a protein 3 protein n=1 Tax=Cardiosporidium cionae TaxID=476202 RepID=A0ABQ7J6V1_9APIC|nr:replication factor a protein 3 protein [Cardiosporidium cionae]|eukprot:KAF8819713.1 replication factor a protein 3 protein [Cardiosporidium cionae]
MSSYMSTPCPSEGMRLSETMESYRRVNGGQLSEFLGKTIRFIGEIKSISERSLLLNSVDGMEVSYTLLQSTQPTSRFIEVIATVLSPMALQQQGPIIELGNELNMQNFNAAIKLTFCDEFNPHFQPCCISPSGI